jgi:hypothetical protein
MMLIMRGISKPAAALKKMPDARAASTLIETGKLFLGRNITLARKRCQTLLISRFEALLILDAQGGSL